jgi:molecular chaperone DnaK
MTELPLVRVRLKYPDVETFTERFAPNVTRGGIFLASRDPRPVGTVVRFEVSLVSGAPVLVGKGRVTWTKAHDPAEPTKPYGMGVQFIELDRASRAVLDKLLRKREPAARPATPPRPPGSPPPIPADAAKTQPLRAPVPPVPVPVAAPAPAPVSTPVAVAVAVPVPVPVPVAKPIPLHDDLAALDRIDDEAMKRAAERARVLAAGIEDIDELLRSSDDPAPTLAQALAELPRYLGNRSDSRPVH